MEIQSVESHSPQPVITQLPDGHSRFRVPRQVAASPVQVAPAPVESAVAEVIAAPEADRVMMPDPRPVDPIQVLADGKLAIVPVDWLRTVLSGRQVEALMARRSHRTATSTTKFCPGCAAEKSFGEFYKSASTHDHVQPRCKSCQLLASQKRHAAKHVEHRRVAHFGRVAGLYRLSGPKRHDVRGRENIKRVYDYFKVHGKGVTAKQVQVDLKMPPSTVHWTLNRLQKKRAIAYAPAH